MIETSFEETTKADLRRLSTKSRQCSHFTVSGVLLLAFILRLLFILGMDHGAPYRDTGGDARWYLANGYALFNGLDNTVLPDFGGIGDYPIALATLPTAPLYLLFVGFWQTTLPDQTAVFMIRLLQAVMSAATCYLIYRTARIVSGDARVGFLAAGTLAIHPAFIQETGQIATETLFIFLIAAALALYSGAIINKSPQRWQMITVAVLLALATLTRAVSILFPVGLALHLLISKRPRGVTWRVVFTQAAVLLLIYTALASTWTIYNLARYNRLVIGAEGFASFLLYGALGNFDENREAVEAVGDTQEALVEEFTATVSSDPSGWLQRRVTELGRAYLQPHGTLFYSGDSLRDLLAAWWRDDRSISGLLALTGGDYFWQKFALYLLHFTALVGGLLGIIIMRKHWWLTLPLIGWIAYITLLHFFLTALPRYLFPMEAYWWVFACITNIMLIDRLRRQKSPREAPTLEYC